MKFCDIVLCVTVQGKQKNKAGELPGIRKALEILAIRKNNGD